MRRMQRGRAGRAGRAGGKTKRLRQRKSQNKTEAAAKETHFMGKDRYFKAWSHHTMLTATLLLIISTVRISDKDLDLLMFHSLIRQKTLWCVSARLQIRIGTRRLPQEKKQKNKRNIQEVGDRWPLSADQS